MAIPKILLYYVFTPLADPEAVRLWQRDLCEALGLRGRILISKDGLNGTIGGDLPAVKRYVRKTREYPAFHDIDFRWSEGTGLDEAGLSLDFPRLVVKVREEIVSFGAPGDLTVTAAGVQGGGTRLSPAALHELAAEHGDDLVFFDGRNSFEAEIGRFRGAVVPDVATTRDFAAELDSGRYDHLKNRPVVTYCTGGIRCEVLSSLMKDRGFGEVYQLDGGIVGYGEAYGNAGLWDGSLYVFDQRMSVDFAGDTAVLGRCACCAAATNRMQNCREPSCRAQLVVCPDCAATAPACPAHS
ncbi:MULTISPECIES: rhodanese-related sulfurtransferase [Cryobacterium]|uniref:tRNA uridine(34) hydroxylase n=1 Tax=Cryobacterium glucosi TaxID=1259175 RepID=A0ABY2IID8_9MICO|nr:MULTISPECIES: rhodanese-related sulfurtransferase [Cryobacterium]TFB93036.1 rhodanese-related sulfurtransferase [Cryobacterium sp. MDB2-A-1]TFC04952.1 rhodanese-related sulfurtransferase [Cryobacterium sp. MDB2-33-2]TFC10676.1 rhodanese-related sulfurtransferase [Cryobacterium sp. MDB2-A-2]TFC17234.1 rhodanese-related sulfurtransferase [Cryobacterium glucosi]TFC18424.1 rhodanese-related sulfurtransferase [Cryobacterium sp. MDB2-10]